MRRYVGLAALVAAFAGCAGYTVQQIPPELVGGPPGYDVYVPEPYLQGEPVVLDTKASEKTIVMKYTLIWLPNYAKRYRVRSWAGLGKADFAFTFDGGWKLTAITDKGDNSAVLSQIVDLAKWVLPKDPLHLADSMAATSPTRATGVEEAFVEPVLYKIDFDDCGHPTCLRPVEVGRGTCPNPKRTVALHEGVAPPPK